MGNDWKTEQHIIGLFTYHIVQDLQSLKKNKAWIKKKKQMQTIHNGNDGRSIVFLHRNFPEVFNKLCSEENLLEYELQILLKSYMSSYYSGIRNWKEC